MPDLPWTSLAVSLTAALLGAACALAFVRAALVWRVILLAALFGLLALPAPPLPTLAATDTPGLAEAAARALALVALICIPNAAAVPSGLRRAALAAGATPARAWRDTVLAAVWLPAVIGACVAWLRW